MNTQLVLFWTSALAFLATVGYDLVQLGLSRLPLVALCAFVPIAIFAKLSTKSAFRGFFLLAAFLLLLLTQIFHFGGFEYTADSEKLVIIAIIFATLAHCTDAGRSLADS